MKTTNKKNQNLIFLLLGLLVVLGGVVVFALTSGSSDKVVVNEVGKSAEVGKVTYTLNKVELTDERNKQDDSKPKDVIKVSYTVKNDTDKPVDVDNTVVAKDSDKKDLLTYANKNTLGTVKAGETKEVVTHFGLNKQGVVVFKFAPNTESKDFALYSTTVEK